MDDRGRRSVDRFDPRQQPRRISRPPAIARMSADRRRPAEAAEDQLPDRDAVLYVAPHQQTVAAGQRDVEDAGRAGQALMGEAFACQPGFGRSGRPTTYARHGVHAGRRAGRSRARRLGIAAGAHGRDCALQPEIMQPVADRLGVGQDHRIDLAVEIGGRAPP